MLDLFEGVHCKNMKKPSIHYLTIDWYIVELNAYCFLHFCQTWEAGPEKLLSDMSSSDGIKRCVMKSVAIWLPLFTAFSRLWLQMLSLHQVRS